MYDYEKDSRQLSRGNNTEIFGGGDNTSSDFKLRKESLPQWAVDWAKNRFNMDTQNIKFYVMDEQDSDEPSAAASGNNVFVSSEYRNDKMVIKHELTHIYQQAIGTATEGNAEDASLEEEAVQVSQEREFSLAKNQAQSNRYILPREKTNVVQSLGAFGIAGLIVFGLINLGATLFAIPWDKLRFCKKVRKKDKSIQMKTIEMVYDAFSWTIDKFNTVDDFVELCRVVDRRRISAEKLNRDSREFQLIGLDAEFLIMKYTEALRNGYKGLGYEEANKFGYFGLVPFGTAPIKSYTTKDGKKIHQQLKFVDSKGRITIRSVPENHSVINSVEDAKGKVIKRVNPINAGDKKRMHDAGTNYLELYNLTDGFTSRTVENVDKDVWYLFGRSLRDINWEMIMHYKKWYNRTDKFTKVTPKQIADIFPKGSIVGRDGKDYRLYYMDSLFCATKYFKLITPEHFLELLRWKAETNNISFGTSEWSNLIRYIPLHLEDVERGYQEYLAKLVQSIKNAKKHTLSKEKMAKWFE